MNQNNQPNNPKRNSKVQLILRRFLVATAWALGCVGGLALIIKLLYTASKYLNPAISDPAQFITANLLNALIFAAIVAQVLIYRKQWGAMAEGLRIERSKTDPRLRVYDVGVRNFQPGKRPVFFVIIANDGLLPATEVQIHMSVSMDNDKELNWINDPIVTIPARTEESFFIPSSSWLEKQHIDGFNNSVPLKVEGYFSYRPIGRQEFCYRYLPWEGQRPRGVPQFVPCDFDPRLNTTLRIQGAQMKMTAGNVTLSVQKNAPEEARRQDDAPANGKDNQQKPN